MYKKFEQLIQEHGVTAYQVAKDLGFTPVLFSDWKSGKSKPKIDKLMKIANYFNIPVTELIEE